MSATMKGKRFFIPLSDNGVMELPLDNLPDQMHDLLEVLQGEVAPLELWLALAKIYLSQDKVESFLKLMTEACSPEAEGFYNAYSRIRMFCALAAYYTNKGRMEKSAPIRSDAFNQARQLLQDARRIDFAEQLPVLGLGQLYLAQGKLEDARKEFEQARTRKNNDQINVAPVIALANMALQAGRVEEALARYKRALMDHPTGPPEMRLGIAVCYYRKGDHARAQAAFERVLELDPRNVEALQGLAVIKLNSDSGEEKREAIMMLQDGFDFDPSNTAILNVLAHEQILRGEYEKAEAMAKAAVVSAENDKTKAYSMLLIARASHAIKKFPEASTYYQQASRLDESLALPHLGLAQLNLRNNEFKNAISELEAVLQASPSSLDALKMLGKLYRQQPQRVEKAITSFFNKFDWTTSASITSSDTWEMFGELQSVSDPKAALQAYSKALELGQEKGMTDETSVKIMNNTAVLHLRLGEAQEARFLMRKALEHGQSAELPDTLLASMKFNMARVHEASSDFKSAEELYKEVLEEYPAYTACYLRLAAMSKAEGKRQEAQDWVQQALDNDPKNCNALATMASLHLERRMYHECNASVGEMLKIEKMDACALLIKGNLALNSVPSKAKKDQSQSKFEQMRKDHFMKALECYKLALSKSPGNAYAANGVGVVLAEEGAMTAAKEVFSQVQEAVAANPTWQIVLPDAHLNLANVLLACQDYVSAIKMYQAVLSRHYNNKDSGVLLYLARAYYDCENLLEAKRTLLKAIHVAPTDPRLRFNLALVMQQYAVQRLATQKTTASAAERLELVEVAQEELNQALRFFRRLRELKSSVTGIEDVKLKKHLEYCQEVATKAELMSAKARKEASAADKKYTSQKLALDAQKAEAEYAREKQRLKEQREKEARERMAMERQNKLEQLKEQWAEHQMLAPEPQRDANNKKRKGKTDDNGFLADDTALDELEARAEHAASDGGREDDGDGSRHKKKSRTEDDSRRAELAAVGLDDSDDEADGDAPLSGADAGGGTDGPVEDDGDVEPTKDAQRARRSAVLSDEEDDVQDGPGTDKEQDPPSGEQAKQMNELFGSSSDDDEQNE